MCDGGEGSGNQRKRDHMEKCYESINADDHHSSGLIHRKSSGRNSHCREYFFYVDGVGKLAVDAINMRDYPIIQAYVAWMAVIYVLVNLVTDIVYHYLDPRVRLGGDRAWVEKKDNCPKQKIRKKSYQGQTDIFLIIDCSTFADRSVCKISCPLWSLCAGSDTGTEGTHARSIFWEQTVMAEICCQGDYRKYCGVFTEHWSW